MPRASASSGSTTPRRSWLDVLEMQPPRGPRRQGPRPEEAEVDRRLAAEDGPRGRAPGVVLAGDDVDLDRLPIQHCWPGDPAPFITLPAVITRDPRTGTRNVGMYRMQKLGPRSTAMHWQLHKDGRMDYLASDGRLDVAVALGLDPVTTYCASAPLPKHIDEFMFAGFLKRRAGRAGQVQDDRPRGAGQRGDRARGLRRAGRRDAREARSATTRATTRPPSRSRSST